MSYIMAFIYIALAGAYLTAGTFIGRHLYVFFDSRTPWDKEGNQVKALFSAIGWPLALPILFITRETPRQEGERISQELEVALPKMALHQELLNQTQNKVLEGDIQ